MKKLIAKPVAKIKAKINSNNEKSEVIQSTLVSRIDIHQARALTTQAEMKAMMDTLQGRMEATIHSVRSKLEEIIKHRVGNILSDVDQTTQGLHKKLNEKPDETQVDLTGSKSVNQYVDWESQEQNNEHKEGFS
jgi:Mg-chelatase subunit ChlI